MWLVVKATLKADSPHDKGSPAKGESKGWAFLVLCCDCYMNIMQEKMPKDPSPRGKKEAGTFLCCAVTDMI